MKKRELDETDELKRWKDSLFMFDSSALLNFYDYSPKTRENIISKILDKLNGRLWISHHVWTEFLKNRGTTLKKPIANYENLLSKNYKDLKNSFLDIKNKTKGDDKHPFIEQTIFAELEASFAKLDISFPKIINEKIKEINDFENKDTVFKSFEKILKIGQDYSFERLIEIVKEGEFRYKHKIPPGYSDEGGKGKIGFQVFGDLIIWKQIIDKAKEWKKPIILITDDLKEDWWIKFEKEILSPREELLKEIKDLSGVDFWMYSSSQFLEKADKILNAQLDTDTIQDVKDTLINTTKPPDWEGLLSRKDIISISGYQYAPCRHPGLRHTTNITWNYLHYTLIITPISNPEIEIDPKQTFDLESYSYLLLNPHIVGHRWLYRILVVDQKLKLELVFSPPDSGIKILDQQ